jgi:hypothetical protein
MTHHQADKDAQHVLVHDPEGTLYAVPVAVMETFQATPKQRTQLTAAAREEGSNLAALADVPADQPIYALSEERLAPYRLTEAQQAEMEARLLGDRQAIQG